MRDSKSLCRTLNYVGNSCVELFVCLVYKYGSLGAAEPRAKMNPGLVIGLCDTGYQCGSHNCLKNYLRAAFRAAILF